MDLESLRQEIDACDREIVALLNRRAIAAREIGRIKRETGQSIFAPDREHAVYRKVLALNTGPFCPRSLQAVYREIMSGCIALERPTRIAYLGPPGTFSYEAAREKFGESMEYHPMPEIRDVFLAVSRDHADYGVVPIENSTEGGVNATCDMLMESPLKICSEIFLPIHHNLLAACPMEEIRLVVSHPMAIPQCRNWLAANLPGIPVEAVASTARAAERARDEKGLAAIASEAAAALYDLEILERCIEDNPNNMTRFIVIAHNDSPPTGEDRTSILFSTRHESGSLYHALEPFHRNQINLTRIESRPAKRVAWEYSFFVDLEGHASDPKVKETLEEVARITDDFRILGSYPRAARIVRTPPPIENNH